MDAWRKVLVAYKGFSRSEPVAQAVVDVARTYHGSLHLLNVVPPFPERWKGVDVDPAELQQALVEKRRRGLEALAEPLRAGGTPVRTHVREGVAHLEIIREAHEIDATLVVLTDEPQRRGHTGFGDVTQRLLRLCPQPVWAVRAARETRIRNIMAAVELEQNSPGESRTDARILEMAVPLADFLGASVHVYHAYRLPGEHLMGDLHRLSELDLRRIADTHQAQALKYLAELLALSDIDRVKHVATVEQGEAGELLPRAVERYGIDLLVMGTVSRSGLPGLLLGNTAERILNRVACSVLTVKPRDFVGPVDLTRPGTGPGISSN